jgi:hypothetical protein
VQADGHHLRRIRAFLVEGFNETVR